MIQFKQENILVVPSNDHPDNRPYTNHPGKCGLPGSKIVFTDDYFTDNSTLKKFGPRGTCKIKQI